MAKPPDMEDLEPRYKRLCQELRQERRAQNQIKFDGVKKTKDGLIEEYMRFLNTGYGGFENTHKASETTGKKLGTGRVIKLSDISALPTGRSARAVTWMPINCNVAVEDNVLMRHKPYIPEDQNPEQFLNELYSLYDAAAFEKLTDGEEEQFQDELMLRMVKELERANIPCDDAVFAFLAQRRANCMSVEELRDRYSRLLRRFEPQVLPATMSGNIDSPEADVHASNMMETFHALFCPRCFVYDSRMPVRPSKDPTNIASLSPCSPSCYLASNTNCVKIDDSVSWTAVEEALLEKLSKHLLPSNFCGIADLISTKNCVQVKQRLEQPANMIKSELPHVKNDENHRRRRRIGRGFRKPRIARSGGLLPPIKPCHHPGEPCSAKSCSCVANGIMCEKFCNCPATCKRRAQGCGCRKYNCSTSTCGCFNSDRECDPDLCRCSCATDDKDPACQNIAIQRGWKKHLFISVSPVAGWGCFLLDGAAKGEFIEEYVGEVISHAEAERRGKLYDKYQHSFLFNLDQEHVVDAARKANKIRFANHSADPNCIAKGIYIYLFSNYIDRRVV